MIRTDLVLYGAGGLGREVRAYLRLGWERKDVALAEDATLASFDPNGSQLLVTVGDPETRRKMAARAASMGWLFARYINDSAQAYSNVGEGSIVCPGAIITTDCHVGRFVLVNINATIGHDCEIEDFVSIQPGANLTGCVRVKRGAYIGQGACVVSRTKDGITIGEGAMVGAGALVCKDVPPHAVVMGNPAQVTRIERRFGGVA